MSRVRKQPVTGRVDIRVCNIWQVTGRVYLGSIIYSRLRAGSTYGVGTPLSVVRTEIGGYGPSVHTVFNLLWGYRIRLRATCTYDVQFTIRVVSSTVTGHAYVWCNIL
jgi:hypothetical protein